MTARSRRLRSSAQNSKRTVIHRDTLKYVVLAAEARARPLDRRQNPLKSLKRSQCTKVGRKAWYCIARVCSGSLLSADNVVLPLRPALGTVAGFAHSSARPCAPLSPDSPVLGLLAPRAVPRQPTQPHLLSFLHPRHTDVATPPGGRRGLSRRGRRHRDMLSRVRPGTG